MSFFALLFSLTLFSFSASAQHFDAHTSFGFRSYPLGASVGAEAGYSWLYYGQTIAPENKTPSLNDYLYGFVRPYARVESSAVVNAAKIGFEVYPVSFIKLFAQQAWSHRITESKVFTCGTTNFYCPGPLNFSTFGGEVVASQDNVFGALILKRHHMRVPSREWFEDYYSVLPGAEGRDELWNFIAVIGYDVGEGRKFGFLYSTEKFSRSEHRALMRAALASQEFGPQRLSVILGTYESSVLPMSITGGLSWRYIFENGALLP